MFYKISAKMKSLIFQSLEAAIKEFARSPRKPRNNTHSKYNPNVTVQAKKER